LVLQNTVRGQGWRLSIDPARLVAEVGPDGLTGDLDLVISESDQAELLVASGRVNLPRLTTLDFKPEDQPIDGSLEVRLDDLSLVEAFLIEIADARGSFVLTTRIGGTLADLTVDGDVNLADGYALIPTFGLELKDIEFAASGRPNGTVEVNGQVRSGEGLLTLTGRSERYPSAAQPSVFQLRGDRFLVLDIPEVNLLANPSIDLAFDGSTLRLTGDVVIPRGRLGFPEIPASAVTPSEDVRFVGDSAVVKEPPVPFGADITVTLGDDVFFNGFGFASNLTGNIRIRQEPRREPSGRGEVWPGTASRSGPTAVCRTDRQPGGRGASLRASLRRDRGRIPDWRDGAEAGRVHVLGAAEVRQRRDGLHPFRPAHGPDVKHRGEPGLEQRRDTGCQYAGHDPGAEHRPG
jgi:translocation and assembly module TamB